MIKDLSNEEMLQALEELKLTRGWHIIEAFMENDIKAIEQSLILGEYDTIENRNRDKDRVEGLKKLRDFPDFHISILRSQKEAVEFDPYCKTRKEVEGLRE